MGDRSCRQGSTGQSAQSNQSKEALAPSVPRILVCASSLVADCGSKWLARRYVFYSIWRFRKHNL